LPWQNAVLFGPVLPLARYRSISRFWSVGPTD